MDILTSALAMGKPNVIDEWLRAIPKDDHNSKKHFGAILSIATTNCGSDVISSHFSGHLFLWDMNSSKDPIEISVSNEPSISLATTPDGTYCVTVSSDGHATLLNVRERKQIKDIIGAYSCVAPSDSGDFVLGGLDGRITILDREGEVKREFGGNCGGVGAITCASGLVVTGGRDRQVRAWSLENGHPLWVMQGHRRDIDAVALSQNRRLVASGSKDGTILIWDAKTGQQRQRLRGHLAHVSALAFTDGDRRLVSGSYDGTTIVWDTRLGLSIQRLRYHDNHVTALAPLPGNTVISSGAEGSLVIFSGLTGKPLFIRGGDGRRVRRELLGLALMNRATLPSLLCLNQRLKDFAVSIVGRFGKVGGELISTLSARLPSPLSRFLPTVLFPALVSKALMRNDSRRACELAGRWIGRTPDALSAWIAFGSACKDLQEDAAALTAFDMVRSLANEAMAQSSAQELRVYEVLARGRQDFHHDVLHVALTTEKLRPGNVANLHSAVNACIALGDYDSAREILSSASYQQAKRLYRGQLSFDRLVLWLADFCKSVGSSVPPIKAVSSQRYLIAFVVWGDAFREIMERITLPCLLADRNLPYLASVGAVRILFFTPDREIEKIETMPILKALRQYAQCDIVGFPDSLTCYPEKYRLMSALHVAAMTIAKREQNHFIFLAPDIIISDNYLETLERYRASGKKVVMVGGIISDYNGFIDELNLIQESECKPLSIHPVDLLRIGIRHLHQVSVNNIHADETDRTSASITFWALQNGGYIAHGFHHTPYLISAEVLERFNGSLYFTIDSEFLSHIVKNEHDLEELCIIKDAREANYFELSRPNRDGSGIIFDLKRTVRWGAVQGITAQWLYAQRIDFSPDGVPSDDPSVVLSERIVAEVLAQIPPYKDLVLRMEISEKNLERIDRQVNRGIPKGRRL